MHQVRAWWDRGDSLRQQSDIVLIEALFVVVYIRCRLIVPPDSPSLETLCRTADEELFKNIIIYTNNQHVRSTSILAVIRRTRRKTTISAHAGTTLNSGRIVSVILLTVGLTLLRECCTLAFIIYNICIYLKLRSVDCAQ